MMCTYRTWSLDSMLHKNTSDLEFYTNTLRPELKISFKSYIVTAAVSRGNGDSFKSSWIGEHLAIRLDMIWYCGSTRGITTLVINNNHKKGKKKKRISEVVNAFSRGVSITCCSCDKPTHYSSIDLVSRVLRKFNYIWIWLLSKQMRWNCYLCFSVCLFGDIVSSEPP